MMPFTDALSPEKSPLRQNFWLIGFIMIFLSVWANSLVDTTNLPNWMLENVLTFAAIGFLIATYRKYQFSDLSYMLIFLYLCLHVYGSKYTYAENPFGFWLQDILGSPRNQYDRLVHFSFGFLLAYPTREMCLKWLKYPVWVAWLLPIEMVLSFGAIYELIEWAVADLFFTDQGIVFLGTQGDVWDAQKDLFLALTGSVMATTLVYAYKRVFGRTSSEPME